MAQTLRLLLAESQSFLEVGFRVGSPSSLIRKGGMGEVVVAKLWPDASTNYLHDCVKECDQTGNALKSVLANPKRFQHQSLDLGVVRSFTVTNSL